MSSVIYTDRFIPEGMDGFTPGPITFIRPSKKSDEGLHVHESIHRRQFWTSLGLKLPLLYLISKKWRLDLEVEAYKAQIAVNSITIDRAAHLLSEGYNLNLSVDECKKLLS